MGLSAVSALRFVFSVLFVLAAAAMWCVPLVLLLRRQSKLVPANAQLGEGPGFWVWLFSRPAWIANDAPSRRLQLWMRVGIIVFLVAVALLVFVL